ncbi:MAG TPA: type 4a pilus biogenesis protein PilO [Tepidisphaeraceae bacterium]|nr:type 4a pilus biogenesis protein PilO [Tepidisphaeraceae bacterium]
MALKKIKPAWIAFAVAGVVITAAGLLHCQLLMSRGAALAVLKADVQRATQANVQAERAIRDLPELRQAVRRFARQVPSGADLGPLLESVGDLAADGAPEREIVTKSTVPGHPVARIPFSLQYRGSFRGTITLLQRLQEGSLFTRVERIVIEKGPNSDSVKPLRVQVDFSTFARTAKELEAWAQADQ